MLGKPIKVVFYFPWKELSGGPIYLTRLADKLAESVDYEVYYTDYENSLSDNLIQNEKVKKIVVSETDFSIKIDSPVILITPVYFAGWIPCLHPDSKLIFINWHMCCISTLYNNWRISEQDMSVFLNLIRNSSSVFFCDESHRLGQNTAQITFNKDIVPISLPTKKIKACKNIISAENYNVAVLGRLCTDKIYSLLNLLDNIELLEISNKVNVHIIGDGPEKKLILRENYKKSNIIFVGTLSSAELDSYLAQKVDILFAMGTSVLEGAALSLPSVIIPHNIHPINCNSYVYLHDTQGYCLGWYEDQFQKLNLSPIPLCEIFDDVYVREKKTQLGQKAYQYYITHHSIDHTIKPFVSMLSKSSLTYRDFIKATENFSQIIKKIKLMDYEIFDIYREKNGFIYARFLNIIKLFHFRPMPDQQWKRLYFMGVPCFEICHVGRKKFKYRLLSRSRNQITLMGQHLANLINYGQQEINKDIKAIKKQLVEKVATGDYIKLKEQVETLLLQLNKLCCNNDNCSCEESVALHGALEKKCLDIKASIELLRNNQIQQMDTCEKILSEKSFEYFCGDIKSDYIKLISGLDDESIYIVNRIISRVQKYRKHKTSFFHFTSEEKHALKKIEDQHASSIIKLNNEYYAYGKYIIPINLITTTIFYYKYFIDELSGLKFVRNKAIIDVGGSFGDSALIFSKETSDKVHVFEPTSRMYELAKKTIIENNINNVILNKIALGDKEENLNIAVNDDFSTFEFECSESEVTENVRVITLDNYVDKMGIDVGLIKVDIEGFEKKFLSGAEKTIRNQKPILIISIYHSAQDFFKIKTIIENYDLGYTFKIRKPSDKSVIVDTMLIAEPN
ncbi:FkbM family methyltransferase [Mixta tenebrionis]|uniref:FkbM family methyltransferase n=1 Tax=Mixta tenebrionis TaxID=2562439 RepID=A0A506VBV5_9GAMM|nr:FkbM family methyltransferase [Mixta tenebrionis]TPW42493.1 FkbM family methyltransferase [Mixta tenebrionis]